MSLSNTLRELLWENPMTLEATRTVRRTLRAGNNAENPYATQKLNRLLVGTVGFLYLWIVFGIARANEDISVYLLVSELVLITLVVPCSLYGAIAVEREKQTYESLIMTRLTPAQIVCGKLWWRLGLILSLMALFVPLLIVSHLSGRNYEFVYTVPQLLWAQVQIFAWGVLVGAFSLWVSAKSKKGITALLGIVSTLIAFLVMVPVMMNMFGGLSVGVNHSNPLGLTPPVEYEMTQQERVISQPKIDFQRRVMVLVLSSNLLYTLNPIVMVTSLPDRLVSGSTDHEYSMGNEFWRMLGVNYWGVAVFAVLTAVFVRAAIKTLRGLEMPVAEKIRESRAASAFGKGKA